MPTLGCQPLSRIRWNAAWTRRWLTGCSCIRDLVPRRRDRFASVFCCLRSTQYRNGHSVLDGIGLITRRIVALGSSLIAVYTPLR
jgi:hypothetical protein